MGFPEVGDVPSLRGMRRDPAQSIHGACQESLDPSDRLPPRQPLPLLLPEHHGRVDGEAVGEYPSTQTSLPTMRCQRLHG